MTVVAEDGLIVHELFFSSTEESEEETHDDKKFIWKDVLREGKFAMTPGLGGAKREPFTVIADGQTDWDKKIISMSDIEEAHAAKAFEHVTIPLRHDDKLLDNTGFTQGFRRIKKEIGGKPVTFLQAALGFTEPDIAGKVRRGTIPNTSLGILGNFTRKADGKKFRAAAKHVCLTHTPFINKLESFKPVFASDDELNEIELGVEGYQFADTTNSTTPADAQVIWDERKGLGWMRDEVQAALRPDDAGPPDDGTPSRPVPNYFVNDVSTDGNALVEEFFRGDRTRWVIPFDIQDTGASIAPATRWVEVREAMVAASDNFEEMSLDSIQEKLNLALKDIDAKCEVKEITLDRRALITGETGSQWIAEFAVDADHSVHLIPPSEWKRIKDPEKRAKPEQPASSSKKKVVHMSDKLSETPEGRLEAARIKRRKLLAS